MLALVIATGAVWIASSPSVAVVALVGAIAIGGIAFALSRPSDRGFVVTIALLALCARFALGAALQLWLTAAGRVALFDDENGYYILASELVRQWRGLPPVHLGLDIYLSDPNITNSWVRSIAGLFWLLGEQPVAVRVLNSMFGVMVALMSYRIVSAARGGGARLGLAALLVFPTLVLWSVVGLKDMYSLFLMVGATWVTVEFVISGRWSWLLSAVALLILLESVRRYLFFALILAWPLALTLAILRRGLAPGRGLAPVAVVAALSAGLYVLSPASAKLINEGTLPGLETVRSNMAVGARSAFVPTPTPPASSTAAAPTPTAPPPSAGATSISPPLRPPSPAATITPPPTATAQREPSPPIVVGPATPPPTVLLSPVASVPTHAPAATERPAPPASEGPSRFASDPLVLNARHFPVGLLFLLVAPFPLFAQTLSEAAMLPEMLLWYIFVVLSVLGLVRVFQRGVWTVLVYPGIMTAFLFGLLSLVEGNIGTLVRHRAMLIPFVVALGAIGAGPFMERSPGRGLRRILDLLA